MPGLWSAGFGLPLQETGTMTSFIDIVNFWWPIVGPVVLGALFFVIIYFVADLLREEE